jgi:hypothetical protein
MVAHDTRPHLDQVTVHAERVACETEYDRDLGRSVELVVRPRSARPSPDRSSSRRPPPPIAI